MKFKVLFASLALALGASSAHAAIVTGETGSGELFLSVWDQTASQSYSQDLNVDLAQFLANTNVNGYNSNASWSIALNPSVWGSFFNAGNAGATVYNIAAAKLDNASFNALSPNYGYLTSFNSANPAPTVNGNVNQISGVGTTIVSKAITINGLGSGDANVWSSASPAYFDSEWGNTFNGNVPISQRNDGLFGATTLVYFHGLDPVLGQDEIGDPVVLDRWDLLPGTFQLTATHLNYTVGSAPVPVPAAVWLFGSALTGLIGFSRRGNRA